MEKPEVTIPADTPPSYQLEIEDITVGDGDEAVAGKIVEVHYVGVSWQTGNEFDASWNRGDTFKFGLGKGQVIAGWDQGVAGMKVGGRRKHHDPAGSRLRQARRRWRHRPRRDPRLRGGSRRRAVSVWITRLDPAARGSPSRSRTSSTRHGSGPRTGRRSSPTTCRTTTRRRGGAVGGRGVRERRQDQPARVRLRDHVGQPALRPASPTRLLPGASRVDPAAATPPRSSSVRPTPRWEPTRAARSGSRRPAAGSSASSRRSVPCRWGAAGRWRRPTTTPARWRATSQAASGCWRSSSTVTRRRPR